MSRCRDRRGRFAAHRWDNWQIGKRGCSRCRTWEPFNVWRYFGIGRA